MIIEADVDCQLKLLYMTYFILVLLLLVIPLVIGASNYIEIEFILEIKRFSNGYFNVGITFDEHATESPDFIEQELKIGLFFFNLVIIFYKEKN